MPTFLQQAKQLNINLSQTLEQHLAEIILQAQRSQWLAENKNALDGYNRRIEKHGSFSDAKNRGKDTVISGQRYAQKPDHRAFSLQHLVSPLRTVPGRSLG